MDKFLKILEKSLALAPAILADVEGTTKKIQSDPTVAKQVQDGLEAGIAALEAAAKVFGL